MINLYTYEIFSVEDNLWASKGEPRMNSAFGIGFSNSPKDAKNQALNMFKTVWKWNVDNKKGCDVGVCIIEQKSLKKNGKLIHGEQINLKGKQEALEFYRMILLEKKEII